jgi:hypothetical protein
LALARAALAAARSSVAVQAAQEQPLQKLVTVVGLNSRVDSAGLLLRADQTHSQVPVASLREAVRAVMPQQPLMQQKRAAPLFVAVLVATLPMVAGSLLEAAAQPLLQVPVELHQRRQPRLVVG